MRRHSSRDRTQFSHTHDQSLIKTTPCPTQTTPTAEIATLHLSVAQMQAADKVAKDSAKKRAELLPSVVSSSQR